MQPAPSSLERQLNVSEEALQRVCRRWQITELSVFGSVLRADFRTDSDVDVLVSFAPETRWSLLDLVRIKRELESLFDREVDLITRSSVEKSPNWIRREAILSTAQPIYTV